MLCSDNETMDSISFQTLAGENDKSRRQNVIVLRHGDRLDKAEPSWLSTTARPWDPPLVELGRVRAFCTGQKFRNDLGFPIHRVVVSPFLRCVQTAAEVVSALSAAAGDAVSVATGDAVSIGPSKVKVSIEYGLCEMLNEISIKITAVPKDGIWGFNISELEAMLPAGTVDHTVEQLYQEMPDWGETVEDARARYKRVICALADKYPSENVLLVTHGQGVADSIAAFSKETGVIKYCGYSQLVRSIQFNENQSFSTQTFEVLTDDDENSVYYCSTP